MSAHKSFNQGSNEGRALLGQILRGFARHKNPKVYKTKRRKTPKGSPKDRDLIYPTNAEHVDLQAYQSKTLM